MTKGVIKYLVVEKKTIECHLTDDSNDADYADVFSDPNNDTANVVIDSISPVPPY